MAKNNIPPIFARIVGWGMCVPETRLTNADLEAIMNTNDEWIRARTGIRERRIAGERESTATLGFRAAQQALEVTDILPEDLDMIIVATCTPDNVFPSTASLIQNWLGAKTAGAFDLSAACSGFVYAINMAAQAIRSGSVDTVLVIGAETMSRVMDWQDRATSILFGDGAGAVVLQASHEEGGVLSSVLRSDGSGADLLGIPAHKTPYNLKYKPYKMYMVGREVFKFATRVITECVNEAIYQAGITLDEVKLIIPHQANERILLSAARSLNVEPDRFMSNLEHYGNTSAASIPIALAEAVQQGRIRQGDYIVFVGFGGGLSWGAIVVQWSIPHPEDVHASRIAQQRRRLSYFRARLRDRWRVWKRRFNATLNRIRPDYGRIHRLRHKIDEFDFDD